jgi:long-chain acyl-CoA synthetase
MSLLYLLEESFRKYSEQTAIEVLESDVKYTYEELQQAAVKLAKELTNLFGSLKGKMVGLMIDNSPEWIIADLALLHLNAVEIPVPMSFTKEQINHLLANADLCIVNDERSQQLISSIVGPYKTLNLKTMERINTSVEVQNTNSYVTVMEHVIKIIHTSGTTSNPKGVMISGEALSILLQELSVRLGSQAAQRYLSVVPFSLLIEQVSGVYLPLLHGGTTLLLPQDFEPLTGGVT